MLTAASLCFCKLLNPSASERLLISNTLEASTSLRLCLPHREIDIIVPIVFIVFIVSIITIPPILYIASFPASLLSLLSEGFSGKSLSVFSG